MAVEYLDASDHLSLGQFDIAVGNKGEKDFNTIVLGTDVVVPVELDIDADPLQDDEVNLRNETGSYDRTLLVSDHDVTADADSRLMYYRFRFVPAGIYRVAVKVSAHWVTILRDLLVTKDGVFLGSERVGENLPSNLPAKAESGKERADSADEPADGPTDDPCMH